MQRGPNRVHSSLAFRITKYLRFTDFPPSALNTLHVSSFNPQSCDSVMKQKKKKKEKRHCNFCSSSWNIFFKFLIHVGLWRSAFFATTHATVRRVLYLMKTICLPVSNFRVYRHTSRSAHVSLGGWPISGICHVSRLKLAI